MSDYQGTYTTNLNLSKDSIDDSYDVERVNSNSDKIDKWAGEITTQLNQIANNTTLTRGVTATIVPNNLLEIEVLNTDNTNVAEIENSRIKIKKAGLYLIQIYAYTSLKEDGKAIEYNLYNGDSLFDVGGSINSNSFTNTKLNFITMNKFQKDSLLNIRLRHNSDNNVNVQSFKITLYWLRGLD